MLTDFSYRRLAWCCTWYLREETLRPALTTLVNHRYHLDLSRVCGVRVSSQLTPFPFATSRMTITETNQGSSAKSRPRSQ